MKLIKIRFGNFVWDINPSEVRVEYENKTDEEMYVGKEARLENHGMKLRKVKGKGVFFGDDKLIRYEELERVFLNGKDDTLVLPGSKPFRANFSFLRQYYPEGSDHIGYEFVFTECKTNMVENPKFIKSKGDENLWDIAYKFDTDINKLVHCNPHIENISFIRENEVVYLC